MSNKENDERKEVVIVKTNATASWTTMDVYEVNAVGKLYTKSIGKGILGGTKWKLRDFALSGVSFIYYKNGMRSGEYDISGCTVRRITAEEANQPSAKFAFIVEGPNKKFIFDANNEKNRTDWIITLQIQIQEYRNPIRRFIRTGEIIYGLGLFSMKQTAKSGGVLKGLFNNAEQKQIVRVVVTNFPRIILIDPVDNKLKGQYTWNPTTYPQISSVSDSQVLVKIGETELALTFEEVSQNFESWSQVFSRIPSMKPFRRIFIATATIDYQEVTADTSDPSSRSNYSNGNASTDSKSHRPMSAQIDMSTGFDTVHSNANEFQLVTNPSFGDSENRAGIKILLNPSNEIFENGQNDEIGVRGSIFARLRSDTTTNVALSALSSVYKKILDRDSTVELVDSDNLDYDGLFIDKHVPLILSKSSHRVDFKIDKVIEHVDEEEDDDDDDDNEGGFEYDKMNTDTNTILYSSANKQLYTPSKKGQKRVDEDEDEDMDDFGETLAPLSLASSSKKQKV